MTAMILLLVGIAALCVVMAAVVVRRAPPRGELPFVGLMAGVAWWSLFYALGLSQPDLAGKVFWYKVSYLGVVTVPAALLGFVWRYTEHRGWLVGRRQMLFAVEPVLTILLVWTNDAHKLVWRDIGLAPSGRDVLVLGMREGPWYWIHVAYSYMLVLASLALLLRAWRSSAGLYRRQISLLILGVGLCLVAHPLAIAGFQPFGHVQPAPLLAGVAAVAFSVALLQYRLFEVLPIARHAVLEQMDEGVAVVNDDGLIVDINATLERLLGRTAGEAVGQPAAKLLGFYESAVRMLGLAQHTRGEIEWQTVQGRRYFDLQVTLLADRHGGVAGHVFVLHDITRLKETEAQVRQRNQELEMLHDTAVAVSAQLELDRLLPIVVERAAGLLRATGAGLYLYHPSSDDLEHVVGYGRDAPHVGHRLKRREGLSGRVLDSGSPLVVEDYARWEGRSPLFEGDDTGPVLGVPIRWGERVLGVLDLQRERGEPFQAEEVRLLTLFANQVASAVANAQLYQAVQRELAERKQTEAALRESEARYRAVVEDQTDIITRFTPEGVITFVNDAACRVLGKSKQEIIGRNLLESVAPEDRPLVEDALAYIHRAEPCVTMENRIVCADGVARWFQWTDRGIFDEAGRLVEYQSVGRDITESKRAAAEKEKLQEQLQQAQRMEAVGVLAGGVAHEFNNLLTVIQGNVELAMTGMDQSHPLHETMQVVARTTHRAAALTKQLLAFSRRRKLERGPLALSRLVRSFANMLRPALGTNVELQLDLCDELPMVLADGGAIEQVLMNLVLNARDAMPEGGVLRIATVLMTLDEAFCCTRPGLAPGEYVRLTVSDTGVGMDRPTLEHVFEPFFTTKEVGKGTGLGLSVTYGIVRQHEGWVDVRSEVGKGTYFEVYLPVSGGS